MKSYTNLEQSKKLAKILPLESADMFLAINGKLPVMSKYILDGFVTADATAIPCWSLAALIELLPPIDNLKPMIDLEGNSIYYSGHNAPCSECNTLVDTCVDTIIKLKDRNLL